MEKARKGGVGHPRASFPTLMLGPVMLSESSFLLPTSIPDSGQLTRQSGRVCPHRNMIKSLEASCRLGVCHSLTLTSPFLLTLGVVEDPLGPGVRLPCLNEILL